MLLQIMHCIIICISIFVIILHHSARSIKRFKRDFKSIYNDIEKDIKKAEEEDLTSFKHIPIDGTIKKKAYK